MKIVPLKQRPSAQDVPTERIEQLLTRLFEEPMKEIFSVDPVYLIGELRNGWTDILKDYVSDCLRSSPTLADFVFEGRGGFHLAWGEPPLVHLEMHYEAPSYEAVFWLQSDGARHRCRLTKFSQTNGSSYEQATREFLARLEDYTASDRT